MGTSGEGSSVDLGALRAILKSQYHAALAMLRQTIEDCPDEVWFGRDHLNAPWQLAYHTLYFAHLYLQPDEATFRPWEGQQAAAQHPDGIPGRSDPNSRLPLIPEPYARAAVLGYWEFCDAMVDGAVDALDLASPESGFPWYRVSKLEHQVISIRHIEHHMAQLADRLRFTAGIGTRWVGARPAGSATASDTRGSSD